MPGASTISTLAGDTARKHRLRPRPLLARRQQPVPRQQQHLHLGRRRHRGLAPHSPRARSFGEFSRTGSLGDWVNRPYPDVSAQLMRSRPSANISVLTPMPIRK
jgi:hypothetical protein